MTHRVHTILSILAEDHAPAALRPSILLAVDWPTVAEEAPATGDDASAATLVALRLRGAITDNHPAIAPLAARLATVAASLTATGDKAMATHATALWGAAAALVGLPSAATIDTAARIATDRDNLRASLTVMEAEVARLTARSPVGRITGVKITINGTEETVFAAGDEIAIKPRPQPGDVVPWAEVEDGALYAKDWGACRFVMVARGERSVASGPEDRDIETFLLRHDVLHPAGSKEMTLVARDLGTDPEAWRKAMREWTASESSRPR